MLQCWPRHHRERKCCSADFLAVVPNPVGDVIGHCMPPRRANHIDTMDGELAPKRDADILDVVEPCLSSGTMCSNRKPSMRHLPFSAKQVVLDYAPNSPHPILPADLLTLSVRAAVVRNADFVNPAANFC